MKTLVNAAMAALLISGCGAETDEQQSGLSSVSPDGKLATRDAYPSVVALVVRSSPRSHYPSRFCTASRIVDHFPEAENTYTLLTASHCLGSNTPAIYSPVFQVGSELGVFTDNEIGSDYLENTHYGKIVSISSFHLGKNSKEEKVASGDISVVRLRFDTINDRLAAVKPAELSFDGAVTVRAGGYGVTGLTIQRDGDWKVTDENFDMKLFMNEYEVLEHSTDKYLMTQADRDTEEFPTTAFFGLLPSKEFAHTLTKAITMGDSGGPAFVVEGEDQTTFNKIVAINNFITKSGQQLHESLARFESNKKFFNYEKKFQVPSQAPNYELNCTSPTADTDLSKFQIFGPDGKPLKYYFNDGVAVFPESATVQLPDRDRITPVFKRQLSDSQLPAFGGWDEGWQAEIHFHPVSTTDEQEYNLHVEATRFSKVSSSYPGTCSGVPIEQHP